MGRPLEPGLLRLFKYFTTIALCYFAILILVTAIPTRQGFRSIQIQWYINFADNLALFIYLSLPAIQRRLRIFFLPLAFVMAAGIPVLSNLIFLAPDASDLTTIIEPTWFLFPTLLVSLVLIAWQYSFTVVLIFTIFAGVVELGVLYSLIGKLNIQTLPTLGLPLIQAFAFGVVGQVVCHLVDLQRAQRRELIRANIKLSQNAATLEQLTVSRERNRLARELHDTLAHTLSGQAVNLEAIKMTIPNDLVEVQTMLDETLEITRNGLVEVRRALKDLRPQILEDLGLSAAVRNLALEAAMRADFLLDLDVAENLPKSNPEVEQTIYRIVQESFANIIQHAEARHVRLHLWVENQAISLEIKDDGKGVDLERVDYKNQHGLQGMQERAAMANGKFSLEARPGAGTTVRFSWEIPGD